MKSKILLYLLLTMGLCSVFTLVQEVCGAPVEISLTLLEDAMVKSSAPNTNYGSHQYVHAINATTANQEVYGFTKFNLSEIPAGATIYDATLYLYAHSQPSAAWANITVKEVADQVWLEAIITWNTVPVVGSPIDYDFTGAVQYWDWNVTAWVINEYDDTEVNVSMSHVNNHQVYAGWTGAHFRSQNYNPNTYPPQLNVTYEIIPPDPESPKYHYPFGINSTLNGSVCQFTSNFTDNVGLSFGLLSWNNSGSWVNISFSLTGTSDLGLWNQTLNATEEARIEYLFYVNDTLDNWNQTIQHFLYTNAGTGGAITYTSSFLLFAFIAGIVGFFVLVVVLLTKRKARW